MVQTLYRIVDTKGVTWANHIPSHTLAIEVLTLLLLDHPQAQLEIESYTPCGQA